MLEIVVEQNNVKDPRLNLEWCLPTFTLEDSTMIERMLIGVQNIKIKCVNLVNL